MQHARKKAPVPADASLDQGLEILIRNVGVGSQNDAQLDALIDDINAMEKVK